MRARFTLETVPIPAFQKCSLRLLIEPVHGGVLATIHNDQGEVLERCLVPVNPDPRWLPFRLIRYTQAMLLEVLRILLRPEGGWEPLEAERREIRERRYKGRRVEARG